jgi:hypothetical protein
VEFAKSVHELAASEAEDDRALALNLIYDHRVSTQRALHFLTFVGSGNPTAENLKNALATYRRELVAKAPGQTFSEAPEKSMNHVSKAQDLVHVCNVTKKLIHITNSGLMSDDVANALSQLGMGKRALESATTIDNFLQPRLRDAEQKAEFVNNFLILLAEYRKISPWNPIWTATWDHFERVSIQDEPASWLESVGLQCSSGPDWLLLLRYQSNEMGAIYRPTQLEAGNLAFHFPSPPCAQCSVGGHPIHFGFQAPPPGVLISDFVHEETDFLPEHWRKAGSRLERADANSYGHLMSYRRRHHALLCAEYPEGRVPDWMPDPVKLPDKRARTSRKNSRAAGQP